MSNPYLIRVPKPSKDSINTGLSPCRPSTLRRLLGEPRSSYTGECQPIELQNLRKKMVTASVGPFRVTGHILAVESLRQVLFAAAQQQPALVAGLSSAGMLCCRRVRLKTGLGKGLSNHSWGTAIDLKLFGQLDTQGDDRVFQGLKMLYPFFHAAGWYWGAAFSTEDAMHFELADETAKKLFSVVG